MGDAFGDDAVARLGHDHVGGRDDILVARVRRRTARVRRGRRGRSREPSPPDAAPPSPACLVGTSVVTSVKRPRAAMSSSGRPSRPTPPNESRTTVAAPGRPRRVRVSSRPCRERRAMNGRSTIAGYDAKPPAIGSRQASAAVDCSVASVSGSQAASPRTVRVVVVDPVPREVGDRDRRHAEGGGDGKGERRHVGDDQVRRRGGERLPFVLDPGREAAAIERRGPRNRRRDVGRQAVDLDDADVAIHLAVVDPTGGGEIEQPAGSPRADLDGGRQDAWRRGR